MRSSDAATIADHLAEFAELHAQLDRVTDFSGLVGEELARIDQRTAVSQAPSLFLKQRPLWPLSLAREGHDIDLTFTFTRLCDIKAVLHAHQRIHRYAERLFDAQRHFR